MASRQPCVLLCEDRDQERFLRPILEREFGPGSVRVIKGLKDGGFTFVLNKVYAQADYIHQRPKEGVALVVAIDADPPKRKSRRDQIQEKLRENEKKPLNLEDLATRLAVVVPALNIDTWFQWIRGRSDLDEETDYKKFQESFLPNREVVLRYWYDTPEPVSLPSIAQARKEISRIAKVVSR